MAANPKKRISFERLRSALERLGYTSKRIEGEQIAFTHPDRELLIVLPESRAEDAVRPIDLMGVRTTLINDGVIRDGEAFEDLFRIREGDRLIRSVPETGEEVHVTAASGETSDGMVLIKQRGAPISPCPVGQLRQEEAVTTRANGR